MNPSAFTMDKTHPTFLYRPCVLFLLTCSPSHMSFLSAHQPSIWDEGRGGQALILLLASPSCYPHTFFICLAFHFSIHQPSQREKGRITHPLILILNLNLKPLFKYYYACLIGRQPWSGWCSSAQYGVKGCKLLGYRWHSEAARADPQPEKPPQVDLHKLL